MAEKKPILRWAVHPEDLVGRKVVVVTVEGTRRSGLVTGQRSRMLEISDRSETTSRKQGLLFPDDFELDGDPGDRIAWNRVQSLTITS